jgi:glycosyltransferase involved in cell wall biosynthesis
VIVIDDASTDETLAKLMELRSRYGDGWIKVLRLGRNQGPATARNAGWMEAEKRYIAFIDADDAWHPRKIEINTGG